MVNNSAYRAPQPDSGPEGSTETFGLSPRRRVLSVAAQLIWLVLGLCTCLGFVVSPWMFLPGEDGLKVFVVLVSPLFVGAAVGFTVETIQAIRRSLTRYQLSAEGLTLLGPRSRRHIRWDEVEECELPNHDLPGFTEIKPPSRIILRPTGGAPVEVPLNLGPPGRLRAWLEASLPMLGVGGTQRVRQARHAGAASVRRRQWKMRVGSLGALYSLLVLNVIFVGGAVVSAREYYGCTRIKADPVEVKGQILEVHGGKHTDSVVVEYVVSGKKLRIRHLVGAYSLHTGDCVTVQYLRGSPRVARIKEKDLDNRFWVLAGLCASMSLWMLAKGAPRVVGSLFGRVSDQQLAWAPVESEGRWAIFLSPAAMETNYAAWPERHRGWLIIQRIREHRSREATPIRTLQKRLLKSGIESQIIAGKFLVLAPDHAETFLGRLGKEPKHTATYWVLGCESAQQVERFVLDCLTAAPAPSDFVGRWEDGPWRDLRFMCGKGFVGPFGSEELTSGLEQFLRAGLQRFEYLDKKAESCEPELATVVQALEDPDLLRPSFDTSTGQSLFCGVRKRLKKPAHGLSFWIRRRKQCEIIVRRRGMNGMSRFILDDRGWRHDVP